MCLILSHVYGYIVALAYKYRIKSLKVEILLNTRFGNKACRKFSLCFELSDFI